MINKPILFVKVIDPYDARRDDYYAVRAFHDRYVEAGHPGTGICFEYNVDELDCDIGGNIIYYIWNKISKRWVVFDCIVEVDPLLEECQVRYFDLVCTSFCTSDAGWFLNVRADTWI